MDHATLTPVYDGTPPFASIALAVTGDVPDAAERLDLQWKDVLHDLADVPAPAREALSAAVGEHGEGGTRVLVADADGVRFARTFAHATDDTAVTVGPLPDLLRVLQLGQQQVPHAVVLADRAGADIVVYTDRDTATASGTVETDAWPLHKSQKGGFGTTRFQHTVEEDWKTNAKAAADAVADAVRRFDVEVVFVAGDVHAVGLLTDALPPEVAARIRTIDGSRHPDGSTDESLQEVERALSAYVLEQVDTRLEELQTYRGRAEKTAAAEEAAVKGVDGVGATVEALQQAQVGTLLLSESLDDTPLSYGAEPTAIALTPHDLAELGVEPVGQAPQSQVLVRAALLTGADVVVVPATHPHVPTDGVGALLRFPVTG